MIDEETTNALSELARDTGSKFEETLKAAEAIARHLPNGPEMGSKTLEILKSVCSHKGRRVPS